MTEASPILPIPNEASNQPDFKVPASLESEIDEIITHYPKKRSASLMLLHAIQEHFGFISRQAVEWIAGKLELQPINIYELVTFYPMLHQNRVGKFVILHAFFWKQPCAITIGSSGQDTFFTDEQRSVFTFTQFDFGSNTLRAGWQFAAFIPGYCDGWH